MPEPIVTSTQIHGLLTIQPTPLRDERGFFVRTMDAASLSAAGLEPTGFVQHNQSRSGRGTLRGLHARRELREGKLVRCGHGEVFEVVVDLRPWSPTFLHKATFTLDDVDHLQVFVPPGCVHGFQVVSDEADICYQHDAVYAPELEISVAWDDPDLAIDWPIVPPLLSDRDRSAPRLADVRADLSAWYGVEAPAR